MICRVDKKEIDDIQPTNILPQTSFWARVKSREGFVPQGFQLTISADLLNPSINHNKTIKDDLLILIKYIDHTHSFAYVPYGPKLEPDFENHGVFLETLSEVIRPYLPPDCVFIRYDLMWENQWSHEDEYFDTDGNWLGPPPSQIQEFRVNFNTANWNLKKSPGDILPKNTFFIDLSMNEDDLLYNMRYNTRYNIRKAQRKNIRVKESGIEALDDWYALYTDTAMRKNLAIRDKKYFSTILLNQDNEKRGVRIKLLMADDEDNFLASMFLVLSNTRGTYLYGASSSKERNCMASYALQWEAIKIAKNHGCTEYDMFGSAPNLNLNHPLHGVHVYKKGFGGHIFHRMGCWDYPYHQQDYELIKLQEVHK
ncbi:MAG: peptidoglycan bridge formation glycyltransferase FemA/FemB family protein [Bacteroidales bacterium]|nr:peptidoglycan bridge formation glycyltransferase FemA/FemB family protein [Bacteroidales bacterium]